MHAFVASHHISAWWQNMHTCIDSNTLHLHVALSHQLLCAPSIDMSRASTSHTINLEASLRMSSAQQCTNAQPISASMHQLLHPAHQPCSHDTKHPRPAQPLASNSNLLPASAAQQRRTPRHPHPPPPPLQDPSGVLA